jgi:phage shock protein PspC (stress-responsive transcriptional regulator)
MKIEDWALVYIRIIVITLVVFNALAWGAGIAHWLGWWTP